MEQSAETGLNWERTAGQAAAERQGRQGLPPVTAGCKRPFRQVSSLGGGQDLPGSSSTEPSHLDLTTLQNQATRSAQTAPDPRDRRILECHGRPRTAAEQVLASELQARGDDADALSMMVSSIARMVQAGKSSDSRWKAS
jgi:hypothetical protein